MANWKFLENITRNIPVRVEAKIFSDKLCYIFGMNFVFLDTYLTNACHFYQSAWFICTGKYHILFSINLNAYILQVKKN